MHTWMPVERSTAPTSHALPGVHCAPCVHGLHAPARHTAWVPQALPLATSVPVSVHTPVAQFMAPTWHAPPAGVHEAPSTHASTLGVSVATSATPLSIARASLPASAPTVASLSPATLESEALRSVRGLTHRAVAAAVEGAALVRNRDVDHAFD